MSAPSVSDGFNRAVEVIAIPSATIIFAIILIKEFYSPILAGLAFIVLTILALFGVYLAAEYWNIEYTAGFVIGGILLFFLVPSIISEIIHWFFGIIAQLITAAFIIGMILLFVEKSGLS